MAKYKQLKDSITARVLEANEYKHKYLDLQIDFGKANNKILELEELLDQTTIERNVARISEGTARTRYGRLQEEMKHPSSTKLILANNKLKGEVAHLQRLVNTRRR